MVSLLPLAVREYQRAFDETRACFSKNPLENWATHIADATRYLALTYKRLYDINIPPSNYNSNL
jgi:hypothetical protein